MDRQLVTLSQVVHRATEVVDPDGADPDVTEFFVRHEDDDRPVRGLAEIGDQLAESAGTIDPEQESGPLQVTVAVATYLAHRLDELEEDPDDLVRLAVRSEFDGRPPASVANWLDLNSIDI